MVDTVIVYDEGWFFKSILDDLASKLRALGAERKRIGESWYWVLRRDYKPGEVIKI